MLDQNTPSRFVASKRPTNGNDADDNNTASSDPASLPEPGTLALLGLGLGGPGLYSFSRRKSVKA